MLIEIKIPSVGESVTEALLAQWFKSDGDPVQKDEPLFVIETDKVTLEIVAEADGVLSIKVAEGEMVAIGAVVGTLDSEGTARAGAAPAVAAVEDTRSDKPAPPAEPAKPVEPEQPPPEPEMPVPAPDPAPVPLKSARPSGSQSQLAPSVRRLVAEKNLDPALIPGTGPGGRITKGDVVLYLGKRPTNGFSGHVRSGSSSGNGKNHFNRRTPQPKTDEPDPAAHRRPPAGGQTQHGHANHFQ